MSSSTQYVQTLMEKIQSLPPDRIEEVEDFVDFLKARSKQRNKTATSQDLSDFPVEHLGPWPEGLSFRREDMYSDDER